MKMQTNQSMDTKGLSHHYIAHTSLRNLTINLTTTYDILLISKQLHLQSDTSMSESMYDNGLLHLLQQCNRSSYHVMIVRLRQ